MSDLPRVLFMGTPEFGAAVLGALLAADYPVVGVVTQPDRKTGRRQELTPSPVKLAALKNGIPVLQPERIRREDALAACAALQPEVVVTAAYGQLLPDRLLALAPRGAYNVHASLLPRYRGGAPIQRAVMNGDGETGVTIMTMVARMDAGPMWARAAVAIGPDDTYGDVHDRLARAGGRLLVETLPGILQGRLTAEPQDEAQATLAPLLTRADELLDLRLDARALADRVRALVPGPGAFAWFGDKPLKVWYASAKQEWRGNASVGQCVEFAKDGPVIACGAGALVLRRVQLAGKTVQSGPEFARGLRSPAALFLRAAPVSPPSAAQSREGES